MIVLLVWAAAVLLAVVLLAVLGFELAGHLRRLSAALAVADRELAPQLRDLVGRLPGGSGAHRSLEPPATANGSGPRQAGRHRARS